MPLILRPLPPPPPLRKHCLVLAHEPVLPSFWWNFLTPVFMVRNVTLCDCASLVERKVGLIMLVVVPPAHTNILLAIATQ